MLIYWINLIMVPVWAILFKVSRINNKRILLIILFIQMYLILALRNPLVGADTIGYTNAFERIKDFSFFNLGAIRFEYGYVLLNKILAFVENHQMFIAIMAFIPLFLFFVFIYRESKIVWLSVFLFIVLGFYTNTFNLFRQIISMGLVAMSYTYIKSSNLKMFFAFVISASLFHITALIFLPVYFFRKISINFKVLIFYSFVASLTILMSKPIIKFALNTFGTIDYEIKDQGGLGLLIVLSCVLLIGLYFKENLLKKAPNDLILYHILFFAIIIQILALDFSLMTRVTKYFTMFLIVFIPNVIASVKDKKLVVLGIYILCCLTTLLYYTALNDDLSSIVPYKFYFK